MKPLSMPTSVFLGVTNKCNFICKHCNVFLSRETEELTTEEILSLLSQLARHKVFHLIMSGGEPFARSDIFTILDFISTLPFRLQINTNAALITDAIAKRLRRNKRLDNFLVGFDGSNPQGFDALRGEGSFEKALRGVRNLIQYSKRDVGFFTVVNKFNFRDLRNIASLAKSLGVKRVRFEPLLYQGNALRYQEELALNDAETIFVYDCVKMLSQEFGSLIDGNYYTMGEQFRHWDEECAVEIDSTVKGSALLSCEGTVDKIMIRPDGWVVPCDRLWDLKLGDIHTQSLKEIWLESEAIREFRTRFSHTVDERAECTGCIYRLKCQGGCPAVPYYMDKGVMGYDPQSCYKLYKECFDNSRSRTSGFTNKRQEVSSAR